MPDTTEHDELQAMIARALVEPSFCDALLNGDREACLDEFQLSAPARAAAVSAQGDTLGEFAGQLDNWLQFQRDRPAVMSFVRPMPRRVAEAA